MICVVDGRRRTGPLAGKSKGSSRPLQQYEDAAVGDGDDQKQEGEDHADLMAHRRRAPGDDGPDDGGVSSAANNAATNRSAP